MRQQKEKERDVVIISNDEYERQEQAKTAKLPESKDNEQHQASKNTTQPRSKFL